MFGIDTLLESQSEAQYIHPERMVSLIYDTGAPVPGSHWDHQV